MFWGAIGVQYKSALITCSNAENAEEYQNILSQSGIVPECNKIYGRNNWFLMQDGAACHSAETTQIWLDDHCMVVPGWPPNSPDLNPIEVLWAVVKRRLRSHVWEDGEDITGIVRDVWAGIDQTIVDSLVQDFVRRCRMVLNSCGESISQHLSSHRQVPEPIDPTYPREWTEDDEKELSRLVDRLGRKWKNISGILQRSPAICKNHYRFMTQDRRNKERRQMEELPPITFLLPSGVDAQISDPTPTDWTLESAVEDFLSRV